MRTVRIILWVLVALAAAGAAWLASRPAPRGSATVEAPSAMAIGGPFTLVGTDGKAFSSARLDGKPYALFFGFTHCPDVCPTTLARLERLRKELGKGADAFAIVLVTVDPERDTPPVMRDYAGLFASPIIALTGSPRQVDEVVRLFGATARKVGTGEDYTVEHTATVFLMDRTGKFRSTIAPDEGDEPAMQKLRAIVE